MRLALLLLAVLFVAIAASSGLYQENGYVLIAWKDTAIEMSLAMLVILIALLYALLWLLARILVGTWRLPARLRALRRRVRLEKARKALTRGLIEISEGRWRDSEKTLLRHAKHSETPLPHYLLAARAAQMQGAHERRDNHLRLAYETTPAATTAVLLTQAELQLAHGQLERALATLSRLRELVPDHPHMLRLFARLYEKQEDWHALHGKLGALRKANVMDDAALDELTISVYRDLLASTNDTDHAESLWRELPRPLRQDPSLVRAYAETLHRGNRGDDAESLLRSVLRKRWDDKLVLLYGMLQTGNPGKQLTRAESWLRERGDAAVLLLTCGRLCMRNSLWGKARSYLESSVAASPRADTWMELARLMEHTGETVRAAECYRKGLQLTLNGESIVANLKPVEQAAKQRTAGKQD